MPAPSAEAESREFASVSAASLRPEGLTLVNRPGRVFREGAWWVFAFESDHPEHPEPPMKLLASRGVELMAQTAERGERGLVFLVSGEVTVFEGENYLLPTLVTRRIELGNLRP